MDRVELLNAAAGLLRAADAVRAAWPDPAAMSRLPAGDTPPAGPADGASAALITALGYVRDELAVVRGGRADTLAVLDDEVANARRLLAALGD